ncbi:MAG TPA: APC family permease [Methylomirabilota bacterium]|nr:APC family permease [Methylomirabilota bacterium]
MTAISEPVGQRTLHRTIDWKKTFWIASGVPPLVLFSIGGIAATIGTPSYLVWTLSIIMGFVQSFTYAEIAGIFDEKAGGAANYGATAWLRYGIIGRFMAPLSVWTYWFAWSPVLAIGSGIAAGYILNVLLPPDSTILTWSVTLLDLGFLKEGLQLRINSTFFIGAALLLVVFAAQHHGILRTARIQTIIGVAVIVPLLIVGVVPLLTGQVIAANFSPFTPLALDANKNIIPGEWNLGGWTLFLGGMFIAAWSTYGFETAVCYTREFKNPATDTYKAIFYSGLLCVLVFVLVPFTFQGALGVAKMLDPGIYDGSGVAAAMASIVGGGVFVGKLLVLMMILALVLSIMTTMAGSSRTLYQASADGWLPKYLSYINPHGAPTRAMWTDLIFNLILLLMSDYVFLLAVSNCAYIVFNFLCLNAGWIHRIDSGDIKRPWRAPNWLLGLGTIFAFVNMLFMGAGANVWGPATLITGVVVMALIVPIFAFRHYFQDGGVFPDRMLVDLGLQGRDLGQKKAGMLPYAALAAGVVVTLIAHWVFVT